MPHETQTTPQEISRHTITCASHQTSHALFWSQGKAFEMHSYIAGSGTGAQQIVEIIKVQS